MVESDRSGTAQAQQWLLALVQHPMYMLIKEDTGCAERTPPWGEPTIERYTERLRDNLAFLRRHPEVKIGYEWSALELEMLAEDAPDVLADLACLANERQVTFYNGTYAQPHLHAISAEANILQLEYGMEVYRRLRLRPPVTYAHQESSAHDQAPQILRAFGLRYAVLPNGFPTTLSWLDPSEVVTVGSDGIRFVHGQEFASWQGLDGSRIPLYLPQARRNRQLWRQREAIMDMLHIPPVLIEIPDMVSITEEWLAVHAQDRLILLDEALDERYHAAPPQARARYYLNWSYIEGIRAEELSRVDRQAQAAVLRAEAVQALASLAVGRPVVSVRDLWASILRAQHHDVYCFCAPELRENAIQALHTTVEQADRLAADAVGALAQAMTTDTLDGRPLLVINTVPYPVRTAVAVEIDGEATAVVDGTGQPMPTAACDAGSSLQFIAALPGPGHALYYARSGSAAAAEEDELDESITFENAFYRAHLRTDGVITSLVLHGMERELVDAGQGGGNHLTATETSALAHPHAGPATFDWGKPGDRRPWEIPQPGHALVWAPRAATRVRRSPLGLTLTAHGHLYPSYGGIHIRRARGTCGFHRGLGLGERTTVDIGVTCYHLLPWIDVQWNFHFDNTSIGTFFDDESKLVLRWPFAFAGQIAHDIPCGVVRSAAERPFFPTTWADYSCGSYGVALIHGGTPKYWVAGCTLSNLLAWGEETDAIGNRIDTNLWPKSFDQRLRGQHTIRHAIYPHLGDWKGGGVLEVARTWCTPPAAYPVDRHIGTVAARASVLSLGGSSLVTTAVRLQDNKLVCRVYETYGEPSRVSVETNGLLLESIHALGGETIEQFGPFQIGTIVLGIQSPP